MDRNLGILKRSFGDVVIANIYIVYLLCAGHSSKTLHTLTVEPSGAGTIVFHIPHMRKLHSSQFSFDCCKINKLLFFFESRKCHGKEESRLRILFIHLASNY